MSFLVLIVGVVLFIALIIVHELGHFLVARRGGVAAEEFGIFFPPRLYKRRTKKGWIFSINLLPLGGFVRLKGEHDTDTEPGSFGAATTWVKAKIMAAGVFMNLVTGLVLLAVLAWIGIPQLIPNQYDVRGASHISKQEVLVTSVEPSSPASSIGLRAEDQIIGIGSANHIQVINTTAELQQATKHLAGQVVSVVFKHSGHQVTKNTRLKSQAVVAASLKTNNPKGYLGITLTSLTIRRFNIWSAPLEAVGLSVQVIKLTFVGLGHAIDGLGKIIAGLVTGNSAARHHGQTIASAQVAGPVGIFVILKDGSALGYQYMLFIVAIISLTLAIMNILPIPALDGGKLWTMLISRVFGRSLSAYAEEVMSAVGIFILLTLLALITFVDVHRFL